MIDVASTQPHYEIAVIGAGIAGASVAAELAEAGRRVLLIEREAQPGYHTTGRSAALFTETYGPPAIRALSRASARFYEAPPEGFCANPLLSARGVLMLARADQMDALHALHTEVAPKGDVRLIDANEARSLAPLLRADYVAGGMAEPGARDIDVHGLHHGYLKAFRAAGGETLTNGDVRALARSSAGWSIEVGRITVLADTIVNAAGAWADEIGALAGAGPIGLVPKRRTAVIVAAPPGTDPAPWPMVVDVDEQFYMKPDAGRLLISPADETPSPPCDAQPDEYDVAVCVDRIETAFDIQVRSIENKWAGLRSFVADKTPVACYDPVAADFFWLAGQGGYGIQSAPALARTAAALIEGRPIPADIADQGIAAADLAVTRLDVAA
ncbi:NAD(P)/FAD-dependent oxidoreductase [Amorphus coralli]|uniref:NAD(P)/FAD-dependent oxidoreductase n=1 Tax=Amorphus coralli TaxID=340680 RepID=UPI00037407AD|nr:FAD-dependent oxidoreductase [Amorphus coralli]